MAISPLTYGPKLSTPSLKLLPDSTQFNVLRADEVNALSNRVSDKVSVLEYGAVMDVLTSAQAALNATALANALAAAAGKAMVDIPPGTLLLPVTYTFGNTIPTPANSILGGHGRATILKIDPASINVNGHASLFQFTGDNVRLRGFQLDGSAGAIVGGLTNVQVFGFAKGITGPMSGLVVEDIWAHDLPGIANESFWITLHVPGVTANAQLTGAMSKVIYRRLRAWSNSGTPFHVNGYIDDANLANVFGGYMTDDVLVDDVMCWGGTGLAQGISCYGAKNVRIVNSKFFDNSVRGLNVEWSDNIDIWNCVMTGNARAGFGTDGKANVRLRHSRLVGNNTAGLTTDGEIAIYGGQWFLGSPLPTGGSANLEIRNNEVVPLTGQHHLYFGFDTMVSSGGINVDEPIPASIVIDQNDVASWLIGDGSGIQTPSNISHQGGPPAVATTNTGRLIDWFGSSATVAAYGGTGNASLGAVTVTATAANANAFSHTALMPGRTYRMRARIKAEDANATWKLMFHEASPGTNNFTICSYSPVTGQIGEWKTIDAVFTVNSAWARGRMQILRSATGTSSTLDVDYLNVEEVNSKAGQSEFQVHAGHAVGRGTAAPTTGTWAVGDIWWNDAPTNLGDLFWMCTTAGTPGTWTQSGVVPSVTGLQVSGAAGTNRDVDFYNTTGSVQPRWLMRCNSTAEGGSNTGSDFDFMARTDAGGLLFTGWHATRSTGVISFPQGIMIGAGATAKQFLSATATWDPPSVAAGAQTTNTLTVTGAALGDTVVVSFSLDLQAMRLTGYVSAANTVTIVLANGTAGAIDLASGTLRADVWQH